MVKGAKWIREHSEVLGVNQDYVNPATVDLSLGGEIVELPSPAFHITAIHRMRAVYGNQDLLAYSRPLSASNLYDQFPSRWKSSGVLNDAVYYDLPDGVEFTFIPGAFYLGVTKEFVSIPQGIVAKGDLKSTVARQSLLQFTALLIDPGFTGNITLELVSVLPVTMKIGSRIIQLTFMDVEDGEVYAGRYQDSHGLIPPLVDGGD